MTHKTRFVQEAGYALGIDIGKFDFFVFCRKTGRNKAFANTEKDHKNLIRWLGDPADTIIAVEPTGGYEWALWQALDGAGFEARQVSAAHVRAFARASGALAKTDPIDARLIADFIAFRPDAGRTVPMEKLRKISTLASKRRQLVEMKRSLSCQMKQRHVSGFEAMDDELMSLLKAQIKELETRIQSQIARDHDLARQAEILRSIPGIGPVLSTALIAQMSELGSCSNKKIAPRGQATHRHWLALPRSTMIAVEKTENAPFEAGDTKCVAYSIRPHWSHRTITPLSKYSQTACETKANRTRLC